MRTFYPLFLIIFYSSLTVNAHTFDSITIFHTECDNGPGAVVSSLLRGLKQFPSISFNRNPTNPSLAFPIAVVLSDINNLKTAIQWKRAGYIRHILAGPNIMVKANEHECIFARDEVDIVLVPSEWVRISYTQDDPRITQKLCVWYAGIDEKKWCNSDKSLNDTNNVLVYIKNNEHNLANQVINLLKQYNWNPLSILYGTYSHTTYIETLARSKFAVFLSKSESQGISLAECWAMNVPTLVWDPQDLITCGKRFDPVSSCPYLTQETGYSWKTVADLETLLKSIRHEISLFCPRTWILNHMTDTLSVKLLLDIIETTVTS